jgi:hypothetical protein
LALSLARLLVCDGEPSFEEYGYDLTEEARDYMHPSDRRQLERTILTWLFQSVNGGMKLREDERWLDEYTDYCDWRGISCGVNQQDSVYSLLDYEDGYSPPPDDTVTKIELPGRYLSGTLPTELALLDHLQILNLSEPFRSTMSI